MAEIVGDAEAVVALGALEAGVELLAVGDAVVDDGAEVVATEPDGPVQPQSSTAPSAATTAIRPRTSTTSSRLRRSTGAALDPRHAVTRPSVRGPGIVTCVTHL
ncbi:MAG TPA: hypothetical protein VFL59_12140, partial [Candidatus Nanopelagicales bacterium]|nr:hypothetical protein [Candidatus Nanopelagicales bacterium]